MRTWMKATIVVAAIALVVAASRSLYFIREGHGGWVLSNESEAYIFIGISRDGLEISALRYPWMIFREHLHGVEPPTDQRAFLTVLHVTQSAAEIHRITEYGDTSPAFFTPIEGKIYANCPALGGLCRWARDHFERADPAERMRLGGFDHLTGRETPTDPWGWSKVGFRPTFTVKVDDQCSLVINNPLDSFGQGPITIDRIRPGNPPERIWEYRLRGGRVSGAEYERAFRESPGK